MNTLESYEQRFGLAELTSEEILRHVDNAEEHMARCTQIGMRTTSADDDRVPIWLSERLQVMAAALGDPRGVMACGWCWKAAGLTTEVWRGLPKMNLADAQAHAQVCEHNPLVVKIRELEAANEQLRRSWLIGEMRP
jgi:hypothetical protein